MTYNKVEFKCEECENDVLIVVEESKTDEISFCPFCSFEIIKEGSEDYE